MKHQHYSSRAASRQRGVVLLFSLVALVVLLIAAVALMRSFNTSLFMSGNIAFKRDLQNQGERAIDKVLPLFRSTGDLATDTQRSNDLKTKNYSATLLASNAQGIPKVLQADRGTDSFLDSGFTAINDITDTAQGINIRYVIDRMATSIGSCTTLGPTVCLMTTDTTPPGGSSSQWRSPTRALGSGAAGAAPITSGTVVYRLTVRVTGPRDTQAFYQSTFTAP